MKEELYEIVVYSSFPYYVGTKQSCETIVSLLNDKEKKTLYY